MTYTLPIVSVIFLLTSFKVIAADEMCWKATTTELENVLTICAKEGGKALMNVYFPNKGSTETSCIQNGIWAASKTEKKLIFVLEAGDCDNSLALEKSKLECLMGKSGDLSCTDHNSNSFDFIISKTPPKFNS